MDWKTQREERAAASQRRAIAADIDWYRQRGTLAATVCVDGTHYVAVVAVHAGGNHLLYRVGTEYGATAREFDLPAMIRPPAVGESVEDALRRTVLAAAGAKPALDDEGWNYFGPGPEDD